MTLGLLKFFLESTEENGLQSTVLDIKFDKLEILKSQFNFMIVSLNFNVEISSHNLLVGSIVK